MKKRALQYERDQKIIWGLGGTLIVLFGLYIFFVSSSVVYVVLREEIASELANIHAETAELESEYLSLRNGINKSLATELGFVATEYKGFAERDDTLGQSLSLRQ